MNQVYAGKVDEGAALLEQVANSYPTLSVPYVNEGLMYLKANQFEAAERVLKRAVERDEKSAVANNYLGVAQRNLGKFKDAEASYLAALATDDDYAVAHLNLAVLYDLYLQHPEQALPHYDRYQQLVPTPDPKIAGWIKEIRTRMGVNKKPAATTETPPAVPASTSAPADAGAKQ
jgi:tetratricopeptide (TPR) repeat protein